MIDIKISLTIASQGGVMLSESDCSKEIKVNEKDGVKLTADLDKMDEQTVKVHAKNGDAEILHFHTRKSREVEQVINISTAAYNAFISKENIPESFQVPANFKPYSKVQAWKALTNDARILINLDLIAHDLHGYVKSFQVFDD